MLSTGLKTQYSVYENLFVSLSLSFTIIPETSGDDYYINTNTGERSETFSNSAGMKLSFYEIGISAGFRI